MKLLPQPLQPNPLLLFSMCSALGYGDRRKGGSWCQINAWHRAGSWEVLKEDMVGGTSEQAAQTEMNQHIYQSLRQRMCW